VRYNSHVMPGKVVGRVKRFFWPGRAWLGWQSEAGRRSVSGGGPGNGSHVGCFVRGLQRFRACRQILNAVQGGLHGQLLHGLGRLHLLGLGFVFPFR